MQRLFFVNTSPERDSYILKKYLERQVPWQAAATMTTEAVLPVTDYKDNYYKF